MVLSSQNIFADARISDTNNSLFGESWFFIACHTLTKIGLTLSFFSLASASALWMNDVFQNHLTDEISIVLASLFKIMLPKFFLSCSRPTKIHGVLSS